LSRPFDGTAQAKLFHGAERQPQDRGIEPVDQAGRQVLVHDRPCQDRQPEKFARQKLHRAANRQSDIDAGITNVVVGFAPLKPAEFVIIRLGQLCGK